MKEMMGIGPPVYWVTRGEVNYSNATYQTKVCGGVDCSPKSVTTQLFIASEQTET